MRPPLHLFAAVLALGALAAAPAAAKPAAAPKAPQPFPFAIEVHSLPNGLRVVFVGHDSPGLAAYYTVMRVGSRNEPEAGRSGYAHFFEHMMFRGTPTHSADDYNATLSKLGCSNNASTSSDTTIYRIYGPSQALPTVIEYEADRFQHLAFDEEQFKTEAGAILGEYAKNASIPERKLHEKLRETAFTKHTYAHTTMGYLADIKAMPSGYDYAREFFRRYYTPDNAIVLVIGDFDKAATLARIAKAYGPWKAKLDAAAIATEPAQSEARRGQLEWKVPILPRLVLAWHTPPATDLAAAATQDLLEGYLYGPTSPLYQDLVIQRQLVDSIFGGYDRNRDPGLFAVISRVKKASDVAEIERAVTAEVAKIAAGEVDAKRLDAVRSNLSYGRLLGYDTAQHLAEAMAFYLGASGDPHYIGKLGARVGKVTPAELSAFAKRWLTDANRTTVTVSSGGAATEGVK
jgi:zinc protease